jgi:hypothetical protein
MLNKKLAIVSFAFNKLCAFMAVNSVMSGRVFAGKTNVLLSISMITIVHDFLLGWLIVVQYI